MGMVVLFLLLQITIAHIFRWRFQYSLRSLFLVMFLACIGMSWIGVGVQKARRQKEAVEEIKKLGGTVFYDVAGNPIPWAEQVTTSLRMFLLWCSSTAM